MKFLESLDIKTQEIFSIQLTNQFLRRTHIKKFHFRKNHIHFFDSLDNRASSFCDAHIKKIYLEKTKHLGDLINS